jgi:hypothetical protein
MLFFAELFNFMAVQVLLYVFGLIYLLGRPIITLVQSTTPTIDLKQKFEKKLAQTAKTA